MKLTLELNTEDIELLNDEETQASVYQTAMKMLTEAIEAKDANLKCKVVIDSEKM